MEHYSSIKTVRIHISGDITLYGAPSERTMNHQRAPRVVRTGDGCKSYKPGVQQQTPMRQLGINMGSFARLNSGKAPVPWRFAQKREATRFGG